MQVTIYTKDSCPFCTKAKMLLANKNISYTEMKLNEDFSREIILDMFPQAKTFPIIVVDGFNIGGYEQLNQKLMEETNNNQKFLIEG